MGGTQLLVAPCHPPEELFQSQMILGGGCPEVEALIGRFFELAQTVSITDLLFEKCFMHHLLFLQHLGPA
jgi:hypothetical protein